MFAKPSLLTRIAVGKLIGLILGLMIFFAAPAFGMDDMRMRIGFLFWYTGIGAFIGMAGVFDWHPILKMRMPWWFMGPLIGAWMNFLLILIAWKPIEALLASGAFWGITSPWWGVAEGLVVGFLIGGFATYFGGEGPDTVRVIQRD